MSDSSGYQYDGKRIPQMSLAELVEKIHRGWDANAAGAMDGRYAVAHGAVNIMPLLVENRPLPVKPKPSIPIGRNDFCPCGSGKKFKRCCSRHSR